MSTRTFDEGDASSRARPGDQDAPGGADASIAGTRLSHLRAWDAEFDSLRRQYEAGIVPLRQPRLDEAAGAAIRPAFALGATPSPHPCPEGWFLGPKAENEDLLRRLIDEAITAHVDFRRQFKPGDPAHITPAERATPSFQASVARLEQHATALFKLLKHSTPLASIRYQGHMLWDQALPAVVGYFAAMLYNQNNVATEASPVTTHLEMIACHQLCRMLGFTSAPRAPGGAPPWGHLASDGSVANIEALWALRNARYLPLAAATALREVDELKPARDLEVLTAGGSRRLLALDDWALLNLPLAQALDLERRITERTGLKPEAVARLVQARSLEEAGWLPLAACHPQALARPPVALVPATRHYSWPKAATLVGLGSRQLIGVPVDLDARMDLQALREQLERCLQDRIPVIAVVAVIGSTEESAVDPLEGILALRESFRERGLDFAVHCDAAWGGYFASMLRGPEAEGESGDDDDNPVHVPVQGLNDYVRRQYQAMPLADSITVDPHKAGYIPYPAGAICYRDGRLRDCISLKAPVVVHGSEPTVGVYGIEGSRPGAAAAAVFLAHNVIGLHREGYGRILGQCLWTSKRLYSRLMTLEDPRFSLTLLQRLPGERAGLDARRLQSQRDALARFAAEDNAGLRRHLAEHGEDRTLFDEVGSDQVILSFSVNAKDRNGRPQKDLAFMNELTNGVFNLCSLLNRHPANEPDLILTASTFDPADYGQRFVDAYCERAGVVPVPGKEVNFLISTTMNPWTTATEHGDFLDTYVAALTRAAHLALDQLAPRFPTRKDPR